MKKQQQIVMLIGLCLCILCALFPPRKFVGKVPFPVEVDSATQKAHWTVVPPHAFIFSDDFGMFYRPAADGHINPTMFDDVEVDAGSLLSELVLIAAATGILVLIPRLIRHDA